MCVLPDFKCLRQVFSKTRFLEDMISRAMAAIPVIGLSLCPYLLVTHKMSALGVNPGCY